MKNRSILPLMEQVIMILVFALAAALCLRTFVWADGCSRRQQARDHAMVAAQNAAETLKAIGNTDGGDMAHTIGEAARRMGGNADQGIWSIWYDADWNQVEEWDETCSYILHAQGVPAPVEGLWQAMVWVDIWEEVSVGGGDSGPLFSLTVAWQEVG